MKAIFSSDFKRFFLLAFTKELIKHSEKRDIIKLQKIIESKAKRKGMPNPAPSFKKETKRIEMPVQQIQHILPRTQLIRKPTEITPPKPIKRFTRPLPKVLFIPEPKLPQHLEYLKPIPGSGTEIDLFKINPLIKDPAVRVIEGNTNEKVIVMGTMGTKPTNIFLNKEDVDRIINKFSEVSKIPVTEGVYRVVVGNLILSAIISETIGSRFIIKKMALPPNPSMRQHLPTLPFQNKSPR